MNATWRQLEGRSVDGRFPLQMYLGGSDHSAVFLTQGGAGDSERIAIKLVGAHANAEKQLARWKAARELEHPNLIRIFEVGRCELDGTDFLYAAEEYAEENLSQILPERALTAEEARGMLAPVLQGLQYLHGKGFVHGRIQPSNVLAIGDRVKLSSDALGLAGESRGFGPARAYDLPEAGAASATGDVWQVGMLLTEALTRRLPRFDSPRKEPVLPDRIQQPFREIIENCLQSDPARRWTVAQILDGLNSDGLDRSRLDGRLSAATAEAVRTSESLSSSTAPAVRKEKHSSEWLYKVALVAFVLIVLFLVFRPKPLGNSRPAAPAQNSNSPNGSVAGAGEGSAPNAAAPNSVSTVKAAKPDQSGGEGRVVERVMPRIPPQALHTITGKIRIRVKINVDAAGNVAEARLKSAGPSKYFAARALDAARAWKFAPPLRDGQAVVSEWMVQFTLTRRAIDDSIVRIKP